MKKFDLLTPDFPHFLIGGDYCPEQWAHDPAILTRDMELMREGGFNEMTMGIFAWDVIEAREGEFDFSLLDERMDAIYKNGGRVILATPSAAHPRWMNEAYPEIMVTPAHGTRMEYSGRAWQCLRSPIFREKVRIIDEKLAERYGRHPALVGWHLSNEYRAPDCYCPVCKAQFRAFVKKKYGGDLDRLNQAYWSGFWAHRYQSFDQIEPPNPTLGDTCLTGLNLDWRRFVSDSVVEFVQMEAEAVRRYSDRPITTNCMCLFDRFDHFKMAKHLDVYANDAYPHWFRPEGVDTECAFYAQIASLCRGMKNGRPYLLMESAPGINNYLQQFRRNKSREQQIFETMFLIATGADSMLYFQWRKGRGGCEKYHGAIVDHLGTGEHRVFRTVKEIASMLSRMDGVLGTGIDAKVAIAHDYETVWALNGSAADYTPIFKNRASCGYREVAADLHTALWKKNIPADTVSYEGDFSRYPLLILPPPYVMTEALAEKIKTYVREGGTLISFYLTAVVNENDLAYTGGAPACGLDELFGLRVDETQNYAADGTHESNSVLYNGVSYPARAHTDIPILKGAQSLAQYERDFFRGASAVSCHAYGRGKAYHVAFRPDAAFLDAFLGDLLTACRIGAPTAVTGEDTVRIVCREGDGDAYFFVLNASEADAAMTVHVPLDDVLSGTAVTPGTYTMPPYGVRLLKA